MLENTCTWYQHRRKVVVQPTEAVEGDLIARVLYQQAQLVLTTQFPVATSRLNQRHGHALEENVFSHKLTHARFDLNNMPFDHRLLILNLPLQSIV